MIPIFKNGRKSDALNYRPVSLTSVCCKVMERVLYCHIVKHLDENGIISEKQFGFRKGRSTEDQLLLTYGEIIRAVDAGEIVDVIYLDFSKAFDLVSHSVMLEKIAKLGFLLKVVDWIRSFLIGRCMKVSVHGKDSNGMDVKSGVPQGSVLGPLLFLIYINSLTSGLRSSYYGFADDYKFYMARKKGIKVDCSMDLQEDLDRVSSVARSWNLKLNRKKCVVMRFGRGNLNVSNEVGSGYFLNGEELEIVARHRDLGVIVDPTLKFHEHVESVVRRASALANSLLRATVCRSETFMVSLFVSHIRPLLDYCSCVWNMGYVVDSGMLESIQRRWTKQIAGMENLSYLDRLKKLSLYSIRGRLLRTDLIKIWKVLSGYSSPQLLDLFDQQYHHATRGHSMKLAVPRCRTDVRRRFLDVRVVQCWNSLDQHGVELRNLEQFKTYLDRSIGDRFYIV